MKIAVDIDDTLNIVDRAGRAGGYIARKGLPFHLKDPDANQFVNVFDWTYDDVLQFIRDGGISAFTEAEARPYAREALEGWREEGHTVIILTARPKEWFGNPVNLSRDWLEKRHIPFDEIVAECTDKGRYCAEHGISVLVDDTFETCRAAQRLGVRAVLAVGKHNRARANEIAFCGSNWKQIDERVRRILQEEELEELLARACPAKRCERYDGWELRMDEGTSYRNRCVAPMSPSLTGFGEKIFVCEERYRAENRPCVFRLTASDLPLDKFLEARGYPVVKNCEVMVLEKIPVFFRTQNCSVYFSLSEEWLKEFYLLDDADSDYADSVRSGFSLVGGPCIYVALREGEKTVAVCMGVQEGDTVGLFDLRVHPEYRRRGYGRSVCERVLAEAKRAGARRAYLAVRCSNAAAIALYRSLGFERAYLYWYRAKEK